jgi:hypothetical protein
VIIAMSSLFMPRDRGASVGGFLAGFFGLLLLIPALKTKSLPLDAHIGDLAIKYRRARTLGWICLAVGLVGPFMTPPSSAGSGGSLLLILFFTVTWLGGFAFMFLSSYYYDQAKQLIRGRQDGAA